MRNAFILIIFSLAFTFSYGTVSGQDVVKEFHHEVFYLKDGSKLYGQLITYGENLKIKLKGGAIIEISKDQIRKIVQDVKYKKQKVKKEYNFRDEGIYQSISFGLMPESSSRNADVGYNLHGSYGVQLNRLFGLGLGMGVDNYTPGGWEKIYPVYLESRGYLSKKNTTLYYNLAAGYGFTFKNEEFGIDGAIGGMYLNPNLGIRFGASEDANFYIEAGVKIQQAKFIQQREWDLIRQDILYQRFSLKIGLLL